MNANFRNTKKQINETSRLSSSSWDRANGSRKFAVAIERLQNGKWVLINETCEEFVGDEHDLPTYAMTDYCHALVLAEVDGDYDKFPVRFFRGENVVS